MTKQTTPSAPSTTPDHGPNQRPGRHYPSTNNDAARPKERAEDMAIAGRHKNTGQKDHKGAR